MRPQPLIAVTDVEASSRWYQRLLGCRSAHGGSEYERLESDGVLIMTLLSWAPCPPALLPVNPAPWRMYVEPVMFPQESTSPEPVAAVPPETSEIVAAAA